MSFLLGKLRRRFDAQLRPSSLRYATWASLMEGGEVYAKSPLFHKSDDEICRFDDLMWVELLERYLDMMRSDVEQYADDSAIEGLYLIALLLLASTVREQLSILERTDGKIVLVYGVRVRAKHTARVLAMRKRFVSLEQIVGPSFMDMLAAMDA